MRDNRKYIRKYGENKYRIVKWKKIKKGRNKGKWIQKHFGSFNDLETAKKYRDVCIENNWNEKLMPKNNPIAFNPLKYIYKTSTGNYRIMKQRYGKLEDYGSYSNLTDAINERDLLMDNNWDLEKACELTDDRIAGATLMIRRV